MISCESLYEGNRICKCNIKGWAGEVVWWAKTFTQCKWLSKQPYSPEFGIQNPKPTDILSMGSHVYIYPCAYTHIYKVSEKQFQTCYQHVNECHEVPGPAHGCPAHLNPGALPEHTARVCVSTTSRGAHSCPVLQVYSLWLHYSLPHV